MHGFLLYLVWCCVLELGVLLPFLVIKSHSIVDAVGFLGLFLSLHDRGIALEEEFGRSGTVCIGGRFNDMDKVF